MDEPIAYVRGEYVPASQCTLPVYDLGITNGVAVTDLVRTWGQKLYRLEDHVRRFYRSCKYAYIEPPISYEQSLSISEKLIAENSKKAPGKELGLVYYITGGQSAVYAGWTDLSKEGTPSYIQHTFLQRPGWHRDIFLKGVHCITPAARHWPPQCLSSKIKNRNRLHMWIGQQQVRVADPQALALYLDMDGNISETGGSNFVIYRDGAVISPRRNNILWGISLTVLGEILEEMGIPLLEQDIQIYDVVNADEAWMPTTPYCLGPVVKLNGTKIGDGRPGPMWRRVLDHWSQIVGKDIYREIVDAEAP